MDLSPGEDKIRIITIKRNGHESKLFIDECDFPRIVEQMSFEELALFEDQMDCDIEKFLRFKLEVDSPGEDEEKHWPSSPRGCHPSQNPIRGIDTRKKL